MKEKEIWKTIENFADGKYEVSSWGRVRHKKFKRLLKLWITSGGYTSVKVSSYPNISVHRLVALAFIPNPNHLPQVDHIDCDKTNNRVENLRWVTNFQNSQHRDELGNGKTEQMKTCSPVVISKDGFDSIHFESITQCAKFLGASCTQVLYCLNKRPGCKSVRGWSIEYDSDVPPKPATVKRIEVTRFGIKREFDSLKEASIFLNLAPNLLSQVATGGKSQVFGYTARYL